MFPQFKKINNESGIVLFIVLMTSIVIMIYSLGILTQSMNEINYAQQQIDQITAQEESKGLFWNAYSSAITGASGMSAGTVLDNRTYNMAITSVAVNGDTNSISVGTNYDSFQ